MGKGSGFGKTILFGEHFVVYGLPAMASAIGDSTEAIVKIEDGSGYELSDNRPEVPGYKKKKFDLRKNVQAELKNWPVREWIDPNRRIEVGDYWATYVLVARKDRETWFTMNTKYEVVEALYVTDPEYYAIEVWKFRRDDTGDVLQRKNTFDPNDSPSLSHLNERRN